MAQTSEACGIKFAISRETDATLKNLNVQLGSCA